MYWRADRGGYASKAVIPADHNHRARPTQTSPGAGFSGEGTGEKVFLRQSSNAFRLSADAAGEKKMKQLIKCLFCGWGWFGHEGDCQICEQCRFAPYPDSIGG
jgi:hypothetical protein